MKDSSFSLSRVFNVQLIVLGYLPLFCFALFIYFQLTFFLTLTARKSAHQTVLRASSALSSRIQQAVQHLTFVVAREVQETTLQNLGPGLDIGSALDSCPLPIVNSALWENSGKLLWEWKKNASPAEKLRVEPHVRRGEKSTEAFF